MKYKHFGNSEQERRAFGDWNKMSPQFLSLLDTIRDLYGFPFIIHAGYAKSGHSSKSYHYLGEAADGHVGNLNPWKAYDRMRDVLGEMDILDRVGFGWYPHWYTPGWHLDCRGWDCGKRPAQEGVFWVRLDRPVGGLKTGYRYGDNAENIINLIR